MTQNKIEKLSKTRNIVSPTKSQTTHYTIIKKSLTPFIFISSNKEDLTLNKSKLDKENLTRKLYLSNNTNNSNSKLKIKSINSLKYINTTNFLKIIRDLLSLTLFQSKSTLRKLCSQLL